VISPFAVQLFLLPFSSHCSTQVIGFSDSGYVIKPLQPSSAIHGAPLFTEHQREHGHDQDWISRRILAIFSDQDWI